MFDTLYPNDKPTLDSAASSTLHDKPTFDSVPFSKFLLKQGEVALAEQIAICGLNRSSADGKAVSFILEELLPLSNEPDHLVTKIQEGLSVITAEQSGIDAWVKWLLSKGREDEAFSSILHYTDEKGIFLAAFPLATTPARRLRLVEKCPRFLSDKTIGCFPDDQWFPFIQFLDKRQNLAERLENHLKYKYHQGWDIEPKEYLLYAEKTRNATLGQYAVDRMCSVEGPGYAYLLRHKEDTITKTAIYVRDKVAQQIRQELDQLNEILVTKEIQTALSTLDIDPVQSFAKRRMKLFPIPTTTCCTTSHGEIRTGHKCNTCRHTFNKLAAFVGAASVLRRELAPRVVRDYGLPWPILMADGKTWNLPVNAYTASGMATLFGTLEVRQLVCVGQPTPPPARTVPVATKK
jgi:hypothetical protein